VRRPAQQEPARGLAHEVRPLPAIVGMRRSISRIGNVCKIGIGSRDHVVVEAMIQQYAGGQLMKSNRWLSR